MEKILPLNDLEQKRIEYNSISKSINFEEYDKHQIEILSTVPEKQWIYLSYTRPLTELDLSKKSYTTKVEFIQHCDHADCDMGQAQFHCPACNSNSNDYSDLWWNHDSIKLNENIGICECEWCKTTYAFKKTSEYNAYKIKSMK